MVLLELSSMKMEQLAVVLTTVHHMMATMMNPLLLPLKVILLKVELQPQMAIQNFKRAMNSIGLKTPTVLHSDTQVLSAMMVCLVEDILKMVVLLLEISNLLLTCQQIPFRLMMLKPVLITLVP